MKILLQGFDKDYFSADVINEALLLILILESVEKQEVNKQMTEDSNVLEILNKYMAVEERIA